MIDENRRLTLKKLAGGVLEVEVNWSDSDDICPSKVLRFYDGSNKLFELKREDLEGLLMVLGGEGTMKKLLPIKISRVKKVERLLYMDFKATKDYKKGEIIPIKAPWVDVIPYEEDVYAGNLKKPSKSGIIT